MVRYLRLLVAGFICAGVLALPATTVFAADSPTAGSSKTVAAFDFFKPCEATSKDPTVCTDKDQVQTDKNNTIYGPNGIITKIANILALIVGIAAVIVIVIAGIQYMLSTGDPAKVSRAKDAIIYAVIGLLVVVIARTLVVFVIGKLR